MLQKMEGVMYVWVHVITKVFVHVYTKSTRVVCVCKSMFGELVYVSLCVVCVFQGCRG